MRRLFLIIGTVGFAGVISLVACSSDDSTGSGPGTDASTDTGPGTDSGPKTDGGGGKDSGTDSGPACQTCSSFLQVGPSGPPCTDNGPPSSKDLEDSFFACLCGGQDGGVGCYADCTATCTSFANPDDTCVACLGSTCSDQVNACAADGADAGPTVDAGDGGDGG